MGLDVGVRGKQETQSPLGFGTRELDVAPPP